MVLISNMATYFSASADSEYSALAKEFIPRVWMVDGFADEEPGLAWLSGGDLRVARILKQSLEGQPGDPQRLRTAAHVAASQMLMYYGAEGIENRLRELLGLQALAPQAGTALSEEVRLGPLYSHLLDLLPGTFAADDRRGPLGWHERRQAARWRPFSLLSETRQRLLGGGLLAHADGEPLLRLRSPLVAYALSRRSLGRQWTPGSPAIKGALEKPHQQLPENLTPTSLDLYLDALLEKAGRAEDGENDHWMVGQCAARAKTETNDQWWSRF